MTMGTVVAEATQNCECRNAITRLFLIAVLMLPLLVADTSVAAQEALYVTDHSEYVSNVFGGPRIVRIDPDSGNREVCSGPYMLTPRGVARDNANGDIFVTDGTEFSSSNTHLVWRIPADGRAEVLSGWYVGSGDALRDVGAVAVEVGGNILVLDTRNTIVRIDRSTGNRSVVSSSSVGSGPELSGATDIVVASENVAYVVTGQAILSVNLTTGERSVVSSNNIGDGPFYTGITDAVLDSGGMLIVLGGGLTRVDPTTGDRTAISRNTSNYTGPLFDIPVDVVVLPEGGYLVCDRGLAAILHVDELGNRSLYSGVTDFASVGTGQNVSFPREMLRLPGGEVIVTDSDHRLLLEVATNGDRKIFDPSVAGGGAHLPLWTSAIAPSIYGGLLLADAQQDTLFYVNVDTGERTPISGKVPKIGEGPDFVNPSGIVERTTDAIYVADFGLDAIVKVDPASGDRKIVSGRSVGSGMSISDVVGISLDQSRRLFALDYRNGIIGINEQSGDRSLISDGVGQSNGGVGTGRGFSTASAFHLGLDGLTYVTDLDYRAVISVDLASGNRTVVSGDPDGNNIGTGRWLYEPVAISVEANGSLLIVDNEDSSIARVGLDGSRALVSGPIRGDSGGHWRGAGVPVSLMSSCAIQRAPGTPLPIVLTVGANEVAVSADEGTHSVAVQRFGGGALAWTADVIEGADWLSLPSDSGTSNQLVLNYDGNPNTFERSARVRVFGEGTTGLPAEILVTQAPNTAQISVVPAPTLSLGGTAGTSTLTVTRSGSGPLAWSASIVDAPAWLAITSGSDGVGNGDILLSYDANPAAVTRSATLRVAITTPGEQNIDIAILQAPGGDSPFLSITPASRAVTSAAGDTTFNVSNTGGGSVSWTASVLSGSSWASVSSGATGLNSGVIDISYDANTQSSSRTAVIRVSPNASGLTHTDVSVTQAQSSAGPAILLNTAQLTFGAGNGSKVIEVQTTGGNLSWTASVTSGADWLFFPGASSGNGAGLVNVAVDSNSTAEVRIGSVRFTSTVPDVAAVTVEVVQSNEDCEIPATVTGVIASDGLFDSHVRVQWDNVLNATSFTVYRASTDIFAAAEPIWTGMQTLHDDFTAPALQPVSRGCAPTTEIGVRYYWVVASNNCGDAIPSNTDSGYVGEGAENGKTPGGVPAKTSGSPIGAGNVAVVACMALLLVFSKRVVV